MHLKKSTCSGDGLLASLEILYESVHLRAASQGPRRFFILAMMSTNAPVSVKPAGQFHCMCLISFSVASPFLGGVLMFEDICADSTCGGVVARAEGKGAYGIVIPAKNKCDCAGGRLRLS